MKSIEVVGFHRENLGTKYSKQLRAEGNVPCVLYGADDHVHFHAPMYLFRDLLYTPQAYLVKLNIEGKEYDAILQDAQFHPISEMIFHVDFLHIAPNKKVKMDIPVKTVGVSEGVKLGGTLYLKNRKLRVAAFPKDLPDFVEVDITSLKLGDTFKVGSLSIEGVEFLANPKVTVVQINASRTARAAAGADEEA